jgi:predicted nucleic acid-binding protein
MLVLDASYVVAAVLTSGGFAELGDPDLAAPALMWSETRSTLHHRRAHGNIGHVQAAAAHERLEHAPVRSMTRTRLGATAWRIADDLGWARTHDAEYVALAQLLGCRLVTLDLRLRRGAERLGFVVTPGEL